MPTFLNKDFAATLGDVLKAKSKAEYGEYVVEYCDPSATGLDVVSAIFSASANGFSSNDANTDMGFARFLGEDFVNHPFVLVAKENRLSMSEKSQKQVVSPFETRSNSSFSPKKPQRRSISDRINSSEVWGSPLKWGIPSEDSSIDSELFDMSQVTVTKKRKPKHLGIPLNSARTFLSTFNLQFDGHLGCPNIIVLCDGTDPRTTSVAGSRIVQVTDQDKTVKICKTTLVTIEQETSADLNSKVKLASGKSSACLAVYQVSMPAEPGEESWGMVAVEMSWKGASWLLESPPSNARSTVKASVRSGSMHSSMHKFFQELDFLRRIITALNTGEMEWVSEVSEKPTMPLTTAVRNLVSRLREEGSMGSAETGKEAEETLTFASVLKGISIAERSDFDFTDHLWKVMTGCMSTADLVDSLRLVFNALGHGELQPFVDQQNQTTVAQIVRESFTGRFSAPSLTGAQPFLFLAEIGAEKLRRDYIGIFVSQRTASMSFLSPFISTEGELNVRLDWLEKLHASLEMVALLSGTLRLSPETLGSAARQMLTHFIQHPVDSQYTFSFSLKMAEVHTVLSLLRPARWSVETRTDVGFGTVQESNLYCLCASHPFLHIHKDVVDSTEQTDESKEGKERVVTSEQENEYCIVRRTETVIIM